MASDRAGPCRFHELQGPHTWAGMRSSGQEVWRESMARRIRLTVQYERGGPKRAKSFVIVQPRDSYGWQDGIRPVTGFGLLATAQFVWVDAHQAREQGRPQKGFKSCRQQGKLYSN